MREGPLRPHGPEPGGVGSSSGVVRRILPSGFRKGFRRVADRVLAAEVSWSVLCVVVVLGLLLGMTRGGDLRERFAAGAIAPYDIAAHGESRAIDEVATRKRQQEARESIADIYVHDTGRGPRLVQELAWAFKEGRLAIEGASREQGRDPVQAARAALGGRVPDDALVALVRLRFSLDLERTLTSALDRVMQSLVVGSRALLDHQPAITVVHTPGSRQERITDPLRILDLDRARDRVRAVVLGTLPVDTPSRGVLAEFAAAFVDPDLALDPEETAVHRDAAAAAVAPVLVAIPAGTVLIREGERFTPEILAQIEASERVERRVLRPVQVAGLVTVVVLLVFFLHRYTSYHLRDFRRVKNLHALLVLVLLSTLVFAKAMLWVARLAVEKLSSPFNDLGSYIYLVPIGVGAILIALLANGRIAIVYSIFAAILFGAITGWGSFQTLWALLVQWTGIYAISAYRERAALLRAGLVVGGAGGAVILALEAVRRNLEPLSANLYGAFLAFLGGAVGVGLLVAFALPLLEGLFKVLTDIRLLELSNLNAPLLSQLAVKAPGSYNHSLVVGTLAEEAAKAIGANSLFCRVAAFYHDIGKVWKPQYYVENQMGTNPHDRLSPSMSALVITAHVKDGIKMAREAGLPEQIVDIIPQHHGTRLMTYFYEKAKKIADPRLERVREDDFRYPGPKPQTREAAIFMLADAVEATARTVEDPTPGRLREVIHKLSGAIVLEGQLDECDLTLADLERIEAAFLRTLVSMHHHRVEYPGFHFGRSRGEARSPGELRAGRGS